VDVDHIWECAFAASFVREADARYGMAWARGECCDIAELLSREEGAIKERACLIADAASAAAASFDRTETEPCPCRE
jgi:hypothetical protein